VSRHLFGIFGTFAVFSPIVAFWLMWKFAFQGEEMGRIGELLIALVLIGPLAICTFLYFKKRET